MHRLAGTAALVIPFLAVLACGGRVGLVGGGGGSCPSPSAVASGVACASAGQSCPASYSYCGSSESVACTCNNGTWACPDFNGPGCVVPTCPGTDAIQPNTACDLATQSGCTVPYTYTGCGGVALTASCTCQTEGGGSAIWECGVAPEPDCPDAQPPGCPDPSFVTQGGSCGTSPQLTCTSDIPMYDCNGNYLGDQQCECFNDSWSCVTSEPACPPDAGGCPDPQSVEQGVSCFSPGLQCPGNPNYCDGALFYDAFECDGGLWNDIAVTGCPQDGGSGSSSGGGSGGGSIDAGAPDAKGI
jgi:hypothetical protein